MEALHDALSQPGPWIDNSPLDKPTSVFHTILLYCVQSAYRMLVRILAPSFPLWNSNVSFSVPVPQVVLTVKWKEFVWQSGYNNVWYITRLNIY